MYERASGLSPDQSEQALLLRHAAMNFEQIDKLSEAKELYERVVALEPTPSCGRTSLAPWVAQVVFLDPVA